MGILISPELVCNEYETAVEYHGKIKDDQAEETNKQIVRRLEERFNILKSVTHGVINGDVRSLIVSGAPGIGKSETIRQILEAEKISKGIEYSIVHGSIISAFQLYQTLFEHSDENDILVLDDSDGLLNDLGCINLLKAALESGNKPRTIDYHSQSVLNIGIPTRFEFSGSMIFITNIDFQHVVEKEKNISKHIAALMDRSLYLDLTLHNRREICCWIDNMTMHHGLLSKYSLKSKEIDLILEYIHDRKDDFRSLSLRTVLQLAQFIKTSPDDWRKLSEAFHMKRK
jgi:hypothetical protein